MSLTKNSHSKYQAFVDGLRAIAVLAVIFYHAGLGFGGGYVGVDVFFVISGYLITGLILNDLDAGQFHILEFWERRVRRILPALAVVALACFVAAWFLFFPQDFREFGRSMLAQALLVSNIYFYLDASYFAQGVELKPLLHTWSLAVEEQFYLFFPFLLMALSRLPRKFLVPIIVLLCGLSFGLSIYSSYTHPRANFYLLPTRAWELLIGAFLAAAPLRLVTRRWLLELFGWIGLLAILGAVFLYNRDTRFPGLAAALPCVGAALVIWANTQSVTSTGQLLAARPVVFVGLISYSLYLWHWPVLVFYKYWALGQPAPLQRLLLLLLSVALAALSWKFIETPVRKRVVLRLRWKIFAFGGAATATLFLLGLTIYELHGVPSRIPPDALRYLTGGPGAIEGNDPVGGRQLSLRNAQNGDFNPFGLNDTNLPVGLLVWGDSHAQVELPVLDLLCKEHSVRGLAATHSQTAPLVGFESQGAWSLGRDSVGFNNAVADFIRRQRVSNVLIIARWDYYIETDKGTERLHQGVLATIKALHDSGAKIWIMRQVPQYPWDVPKALATAVMHGQNPEDLGLPRPEQQAQARRQEPIFEGITSSFPEVTVLDPTAFFLDAAGRCRVAKNGQALYFDSDHVSAAGTMMLQPLFEPIFGRAGNGTGPSENLSASGRTAVRKKSQLFQE